MEMLLNDGWEFVKKPAGSSPEDVREEKNWMKVDLPHDWLIWQASDLYETADAWYRRTLSVEAECGIVLLCFDGVYMDCEVFLNGEKTAEHAYGYTAFQVDLSGSVHAGDNEILVHIRHRSPNSRWYSGSGIFRDVTLMKLPASYVIPDSFAIGTIEADGTWSVSFDAETSKKDRSLFAYRVLDADRICVQEGTCFSGDGRIHFTFDLTQGRPWSPSDPFLYTLRYQFGEQEGRLRFGLRTLVFDPDSGFRINGEPMKLKGVCLHHDLGALGAAFHEKAAWRQLKLMQDMGVNALRTSHNPPARKLLDLCDEMGILVIDEAFDMWERPKTEYDYARFFPAHEAEDVALWVRRDRCHPCVIMWSIGNEIYDMHADLRGTEVTRMLAEQVRQHDPYHHGAVTFGCNYMPWEGGQRCAEEVEAVGYNYGEKLYEAHHQAHPNWVIYGSETASVLSSRGIYHFPIEQSIMSEADLQCSALGNSNTSWGATDLRKMITDDLKCSFSMGQFIWSGIDYIGEPTPYHTRSCYFGQADTACFPKDPYYLFQSLWSDRKVLHIGVSWDWNPGQLIDVPVMTNEERVELLLNGRSLGVQEVDLLDPARCLPVWKVAYEPGELCARALDRDGNVIRETRKMSFGNTAGLLLTCEEQELLRDGHDLAFVTVQAIDEKGIPVENARDRVKISVHGGGILVGTDNGDSTDPDGYKSDCRRLFSGKLLAIVRSNGQKEDVWVSVESSDGIRSELFLPTREAETVQGVSCCQRIPEGTLIPDLPLRKIELSARGSRLLTPEAPSCLIEWKLLPENTTHRHIAWEITNEAGIRTPFAEILQNSPEGITVQASGDGHFYLRALGGIEGQAPEVISQIEITAEGIGQPPLNPYDFVSAGLYDLHSGEIGTGNEKGIAFARDGVSMVGFSRIDFGKAGSDTLELPIFALNGDPYEIELFDGIPDEGGRLIQTLHYEKPSLWNVYQAETYTLKEKLRGLHTLCFRLDQKVHMKGFVFEKQSRAFDFIPAGEADEVYGDSFLMDGKAVRAIGNNVTLLYREMDFGNLDACGLAICGKTPLAVNAITIRMTGADGESVTEIANFRGDGGDCQRFDVRVTKGISTVAFVFLPGSQFDFEQFRFIQK